MNDKRHIHLDCPKCGFFCGLLIDANLSHADIERDTGWELDPTSQANSRCPDCLFDMGKPIRFEHLHDDTQLDAIYACSHHDPNQYGDQRPCGTCDGCRDWIGKRTLIL